MNEATYTKRTATLEIVQTFDLKLEFCIANKHEDFDIMLSALRDTFNNDVLEIMQNRMRSTAFEYTKTLLGNNELQWVVEAMPMATGWNAIVETRKKPETVITIKTQKTYEG